MIVKIYGLEGEVIMNNVCIVSREMTSSEKEVWKNTPSLVKKVEILKKSDNTVEQPGNIEAIVEGLLYIVGEDGAKLEQISLAIDKSPEDTKVILENIQRKYASELFGIELVGYGSVYKGKFADFVVLDDELNLQEVYIRGKKYA